MLIRSQNGKKIINFNQTIRIHIYEGCQKLYYVNIDGEDVGKYQTEDIAIKILDEICSCYEQEKYTDYIWSENAKVPMIYKTNMVYNMPKCEEVK